MPTHKKQKTMSLNDDCIIFGRVMNCAHVKCATTMSYDDNIFVRVVPIEECAVHVGVRMPASKAGKLLDTLTGISSSAGMGKDAKVVMKIITDPRNPAFYNSRVVTLGTFANKQIVIGETIGDYGQGGCTVKNDAGICKKTAFLQDYLYTFAHKSTRQMWTIDANPLVNALSMMNHPGHGREPNCVFDEQAHDDRKGVTVVVKAIKAINQGEEILINYGPEYWGPWHANKNERLEFDSLLNKGLEDAHANMLEAMKPIVYRTMERLVNKRLGNP